MKRMHLNYSVRVFAAAGLAALLVGFVILRGTPAPATAPRPYTTWSAFGGTKDSMQYSALAQVNKSNVSQLEQVWFYPAPGREPLGRFSFSPLVVDGVMYLAGKDCRVIVALDAATGKEIWSHPTEGNPNVRGLAYWESKDRSDRRLIFSLNQPYNAALTEIDARTGASIKSFGKDGLVDLRVGLGRDPKTIQRVQSGMPGHVFENLIIVGSDVNEGYDHPPGYLRAYDVITGKNVWTFHTVPHPGEFGYDTWPPDAWKYTGGVNTWSVFRSTRARHRLLPAGLSDLRHVRRTAEGGEPVPQHAARAGPKDRQASCGTTRSFTMIYGIMIPQRAQAAYGEPQRQARGHRRAGGRNPDFYLYSTGRRGEPPWPIVEQPAPKSDVPGEESLLAQPFPTKPPTYSRLKMTVDDINPYVEPAERRTAAQNLSRRASRGRVHTRDGRSLDQIQVPGEYGGTNWGGIAGDPETATLYVRAENMATIHRLFERNLSTRRFTGGTPEQQGLCDLVGAVRTVPWSGRSRRHIAERARAQHGCATSFAKASVT